MTSQDRRLSRQLGLFDATMVVMGGIVGAGIFINPYVVAQQVHTPTQILAAWIFVRVRGQVFERGGAHTLSQSKRLRN